MLPEILDAASRKDIQEFLKVKVSKERVGIEVTSMLKGPNPELGLEYIMRIGIWNIVFEIPENSSLVDQQVIDQIPEKSFYLFRNLLEAFQN